MTKSAGRYVDNNSSWANKFRQSGRFNEVTQTEDTGIELVLKRKPDERTSPRVTDCYGQEKSAAAIWGKELFEKQANLAWLGKLLAGAKTMGKDFASGIKDLKPVGKVLAHPKTTFGLGTAAPVAINSVYNAKGRPGDPAYAPKPQSNFFADLGKSLKDSFTGSKAPTAPGSKPQTGDSNPWLTTGALIGLPVAALGASALVKNKSTTPEEDDDEV